MVVVRDTPPHMNVASDTPNTRTDLRSMFGCWGSRPTQSLSTKRNTEKPVTVSDPLHPHRSEIVVGCCSCSFET